MGWFLLRGGCQPSEPIGCPFVPVPECAEPTLPAPSLWLDLEAEGVDAVEIVDLSFEDVLVELTSGEPAVVHPYGPQGPALATVTSSSPGEVQLTWVEEERLASADLLEIETSSAQTGIIGGADGVFLRFYRDQFAACDTGDHDWRVSVGGWQLLSTTGEVLGTACLSSFADGHVFSDATAFVDITIWGYRFAEGLRIYEQVTGSTE